MCFYPFSNLEVAWLASCMECFGMAPLSYLVEPLHLYKMNVVIKQCVTIVLRDGIFEKMCSRQTWDARLQWPRTLSIGALRRQWANSCASLEPLYCGFTLYGMQKCVLPTLWLTSQTKIREKLATVATLGYLCHIEPLSTHLKHDTVVPCGVVLITKELERVTKSAWPVRAFKISFICSLYVNVIQVISLNLSW